MRRWVYRGVGLLIAIGFLIRPQTRGLGILFLFLDAVVWIWADTARRGGSLAPQEFLSTYDTSVADTYEALCAAVRQLGYREISRDPERREVVFNTGRSRRTWSGFDFTGSVRRESPDESEIRLTGVLSQRGMSSVQSFVGKEPERLANRVLDQVIKELPAA